MNPAAEPHGEDCGGGNGIDGEEESTMRGDEDHQRASASPGAATAGAQARDRGGGQGVYGREEVSALKGIFNLYDAESTGTIGVKELESILQKVGHNPGTCTIFASQSRGRYRTCNVNRLQLLG